MIRRPDPELLNAVDVRAIGGSGLFAFIDEKIRHEQEMRRQAEEEAQAKKEAERQKKPEKQQKENCRPGGRRGPEGPGATPPRCWIPIILSAARSKVLCAPRASNFKAASGSSSRIGRALLPKFRFVEQFNLYEDAFEKARGYDPTRDFPTYIGYYVERAEVLPGKELDWKPVPLYDAQRQSVVQNKPLTSPPSMELQNGRR